MDATMDIGFGRLGRLNFHKAADWSDAFEAPPGEITEGNPVDLHVLTLPASLSAEAKREEQIHNNSLHLSYHRCNHGCNHGYWIWTPRASELPQSRGLV